MKLALCFAFALLVSFVAAGDYQHKPFQLAGVGKVSVIVNDWNKGVTLNVSDNIADYAQGSKNLTMMIGGCKFEISSGTILAENQTHIDYLVTDGSNYASASDLDAIEIKFDGVDFYGPQSQRKSVPFLTCVPNLAVVDGVNVTELEISASNSNDLPPSFKLTSSAMILVPKPITSTPSASTTTQAPAKRSTTKEPDPETTEAVVSEVAPNKEDEGAPMGLIIGGVCGAILLLIVIIVVILCCIRRRKKKAAVGTDDPDIYDKRTELAEGGKTEGGMYDGLRIAVEGKGKGGDTQKDGCCRKSSTRRCRSKLASV